MWWSTGPGAETTTLSAVGPPSDGSIKPESGGVDFPFSPLCSVSPSSNADESSVSWPVMSAAAPSHDSAALAALCWVSTCGA